MKNILIVSGLILTTAALSARGGIVSTAWEWNGATPQEILDHADEIRDAGFDGIQYHLLATNAAGRTLCSRFIMQEPAWDYAAFAPQIPSMRAMTAQPGLKESIVAFFRSPDKRIDWRDDAAWSVVSNNLSVAARVARAGGFTGFRVDHEDYKLVRQFRRFRNDPPMDELKALVRRRAHETFGGVFAEFPEARFMFTWLLSENRASFLAADARKAAEDAGDVWPTFVDGILDVLPPSALLYDGDETAYEYHAADYEYLLGADSVKRGGIRLVSPENREKYAQQVRYASGLYVEMHCQTNAAYKWYRAPWNGSKGGAFRRDFARAFEATDDDLVWIFSEKHPIVDRGVKGCPNGSVGKVRVQDLLDGFGASIRAVKSPQVFLAKDFRPEVHSNLFGKVGSWFERDKGKFRTDPVGGRSGGPAYVLDDALNGCVTTGFSASPGEIYVIRAFAKKTGGGHSAIVRFSRGGKLRFFVPAKSLSFGEPDADGWCKAEGVFVVPEGVDSFSLLLGARQEDGESCRFSDVGVWKAF